MKLKFNPYRILIFVILLVGLNFARKAGYVTAQNQTSLVIVFIGLFVLISEIYDRYLNKKNK